MRWMKELVKRKKRIVAVVLVLCSLLTCVTGIMLPSTQVIGSETGRGDASKKVESTETRMPETEQTPESTEELEPETEKPQEPKIREDISTRIHSRAVAVDRSEDTDELKIKLEEFNVLDAGNGNLSYTTSTSGNNTVYDASSNTYYDVAKVKFRINFQILKQSDSVGGGRGIREGDYFIYRIPKGFAADSSIADGMVEFKGLPIAEYKKGTDGAGEFLTFTFQKAVNGEENYNDIAGGMNLELNFNSSSLAGGGNKLVQLLPERAGNTGIQVKLPEEPSTANEITKTGSHNSLDNTITWKMKVAAETESKGMMLGSMPLAQLKISTLDAFNSKELTGAEFALYRKADNPGDTDTKLLDGIRMTAMGSGSDVWIGWDIADTPDRVINPFTGEVLRKGLNQGTYYLFETMVPKGYKRAADTEFEVTAEGKLKITSTGHANIAKDNQEKIQIQDEPLTLRIEKYDGVSTEALVGAEYKIFGLFADNPAESTKTLAADAMNQKNNLAGNLLQGQKYKIEETKPPLGYGKIKPAYFMLDASGKVTVTNASGAAAVRDDVKELNPADDKAGTDGALKILDKKTRVDFVKCRLEDGKPINGAKFIITGVFADKSTEKIVEPSADAAGILEGQLIEDNTYVLKEEAPAGYLPLTGDVSFTYTAQSGLELAAGSDSSAAAHHASLDGTGYANETLVITNKPIQNTSLRFIKYDKEDNSGIAGTGFEIIFTPEGGASSQKFTYTVPETGEGFLSELKRGTYVLREVSSTYAYEMGEPPFSCSFTVDDRAINKTIVINRTNAANHAYDLTILGGEKFLTEKGIINERKKGSVTLVKVDAIDKTQYLNGVGFTIYRYKDNDSVVDWLRQLFTGKAYEVKTENWTEGANADGTLTIQGLPWGRYYIAESVPLKDYVLDKTKYEFTIGKDKVNQVLDWTPGKSILNGKIQMIFEKVTQEGKATVGNKIQMYGKFANYQGAYIEWTVGEEPYVIAGELLEGETYVLKETSPFDGYTSAEEISFRYSKSGIQITGGTGNTEVITTPDGSFKMVQKVIPILVAIEKVDETGKMLSGAELKLEHIDAEGTATIVKEWVSSGEAMRIDGMLMEKENYMLSETKAPAGYELAQSVSFTVMDTSEVQLITMVDKKEIPKDKDEPQKKPTNKKPDKDDKDDNDKNSPGVTGTVTEESAENNGKRLPKTGKEERAIYIYIGMAFILIGGAFCLTGKRKGKNKKNNE